MDRISFDGLPQARFYLYNTIVVGSGAAGFNAADRLYSYGQTSCAIVTNGVNLGTSRNAGSDKQTYYKLSLAGEEHDSVAEMARDLFKGKCVDGDHALCEAALSAQCFHRLVELGVPFPKNRYGEYAGYQTDHDLRRRATSCGPYTSRAMTQCLERSVLAKGVPIFDHMQVIKVIVENGAVKGLLCFNTEEQENPDERFAFFVCNNIVFAAGAPAGMYYDRVYPQGQVGAAGIAFEAGAAGKNLTEWQFGLASVNPRWNVSGTYMQVLPKFISTDEDGNDEREFLSDHFSDKYEMLSNIFLKGYQWPFDARKTEGSSVIDLLVYREKSRNRRVWLDFRENPQGGEIDFNRLSQEAREYLESTGAAFGTPIERLLQMNAPAYELYLEKGMDLKKEPLEIALCAQHNNGGLDVDLWWQTNIRGFFAAGEAAATHGVARPGGSALNAGQVGSMRAAEYIAAKKEEEPDLQQSMPLAREALAFAEGICRSALAGGEVNKENNVEEKLRHFARLMDRCGGALRIAEQIPEAIRAIEQELREFPRRIRIPDPSQLSQVFYLHSTLISQFVYLSAMENYVGQGGKSRGSAVYVRDEECAEEGKPASGRYRTGRRFPSAPDPKCPFPRREMRVFLERSKTNSF